MNVFAHTKKILAGGLIAGCLMMVSTTTLTGCLTDDKATDTTTAAKHTTLTAEKTLDVGAQGASAGSVIDIDSGVVWQSGVANANQEGIDLVLMYYAGAFHLDNAVGSKAAALAQTPVINLSNGYDDTKIKNIKIVVVTTHPADQEAALKAHTDGTAVTGATVVEGTMLLVKSTGGKIALVTVGPIVGADKTGGAKIKLSVNSI